jgi:hypothetical protein
VTSRSAWRVPTSEAVPLGMTRNWSLSGVFVETSARPPVDAIIEVTFVWGDDGVRTRARVVRHAPDGIGLAFVEPNAAFLHAVQGVIDEA